MGGNTRERRSGVRGDRPFHTRTHAECWAILKYPPRLAARTDSKAGRRRLHLQVFFPSPPEADFFVGLWLHKCSLSLTLNIGAPQRSVLTPLLYSLYTHDCAYDTTIVGRISDGDETDYR